MSTNPERNPIDTDQQQSESAEPKKFTIAHKTYESMSNQEFMAVHKSLVTVREKLSHPEFSFARYLLDMTIQEFTIPGKAGEPLTKSVPDSC